MTDYVGLAAQIALPAYSGMTGAQIVTALNAASVTVPMDVFGGHVKNLLLTTGEWGGIKVLTHPGSTAPAALQTLAINFVDTCESGSFTTSIPAVLTAITAGLSAMVAASLIAATTQTMLLALTTSTISQASLLGFPNGVTASDVLAAGGPS